MERFHLYAGLGGGFGGARYNQTIEAENIDEACEAAYELAVEEYQSYEGCHGIMNWGDCYEDAVESGFIDEESMILPAMSPINITGNLFSMLLIETSFMPHTFFTIVLNLQPIRSIKYEVG